MRNTYFVRCYFCASVRFKGRELHSLYLYTDKYRLLTSRSSQTYKLVSKHSNVATFASHWNMTRVNLLSCSDFDKQLTTALMSVELESSKLENRKLNRILLHPHCFTNLKTSPVKSACSWAMLYRFLQKVMMKFEILKIKCVNT